ncbi:MAG: hypothetical protein AAB566_00485 [Patescibacteria group bacterium]
MTTITITINSKIFKYNLALLILAGLGLLYYVFAANQLVSQKYFLAVLRQQLSRANVILESKNSELESQLTSERLSAFASQRGMVEAKDTEALYADGVAALSQAGN